jgi:protein O-mannosyl-transferase
MHEKSEPAHRPRPLFHVAIPFMVACIIHAWSLGQPFLAEDFLNVVRAHTQFETDPWSPLAAFYATTESGGFFRPLVDLSMFLDYCLWGVNPAGFHATNLLLFGGVCSITTLFATRLVGNSYVGVIAGLMLAVSPVVPEDVTWVLGRDGLIPLLLSLAACSTVLSRRMRLVAFCSPLLFLAGLFAKEWVAAMAPVLVLLRAISLRNDTGLPMAKALRKAICDTALIWILLGLYLVLRTRAIGAFVGGYGTDSNGAEISQEFWADRLDYLIALALQIPTRFLDGTLRYMAVVSVLILLAWGVRRAGRLHGGSTVGLAGLVCGLWIVAVLVVHSPVRLEPETLADSRYLLPALPPFTILLALACRGADVRNLSRSVIITGTVLALMLAGLVLSAAEWREAGRSTRSIDQTAREAASEPGIQRVEIHGVPPILGRARVGIGLESMFFPPFRGTAEAPIKVFRDLYTQHRGMRRTSSFLSQLAAVRNPDPSTSVLYWDRQSHELRSILDPDIDYQLRGRIRYQVADSDGNRRLGLECHGPDLEFDPGIDPPEPGKIAVMNGTLLRQGAVTRFRVRRVTTASPLWAIAPSKPGTSELSISINHEPGSFFALLAAEGPDVIEMPSFGIGLTSARGQSMTGYLDEAGRATIRIPVRGALPRAPHLQIVFFDPTGEVVMSRCVCEW